MRSYLSLLLLFLLILSNCKTSTSPNDGEDLNGYNETGFFKTDGTLILNRQGEAVQIKGFGLGGWLLPEGYMFNITHPAGEGATEIYEQVERVLGAADTKEWIKQFRDNFVTEEDIKTMKEWGADHIRVPFHYNLFYDIDKGEFIDEGFDRIDELLIWCKRNRVDVILDMHAAPGAQSDGPIADSDGTARFWTESDTYWPITIKIWEKLANRYKNETIIIGYDLLNEPVTPSPYSNIDLAKFYSQIIPAVRKIDKNHILFIEGNYYATTFDHLMPPMDDNMVYAFHKYWNETDQGTIQYLVNISNQYNVPLWLGESGENSNPWFYETIALMEANNIGWNWWTHKKLETITAPFSAPSNSGYDAVLAYWKGEGPAPSAQEAKDGLFKMVEDLKSENCDFRPDVVASLFSPTFGSENEPYTELTIPGQIDAVLYDIGYEGVSYHDSEYKRVSSDNNQNTGNNGWSFRNDGVDIERSDDPRTEYNIGWTDDGEWLEYTVTVTAGTYNMEARVASPNGQGSIRLFLDDTEIIETTYVPSTGGYQNWQQMELGSYTFPAGTHILKVAFPNGGFNFSKLLIE